MCDYSQVEDDGDGEREKKLLLKEALLKKDVLESAKGGVSGDFFGRLDSPEMPFRPFAHCGREKGSTNALRTTSMPSKKNTQGISLDGEGYGGDDVRIVWKE